MKTFDYKCMRCQERHQRPVPENDLNDTYFAPCPVCGFVARRMAPMDRLEDGAKVPVGEPALSLVSS